ncbi:MAG: SDR family NAD(P)-dependent oxidoreductase, partial [Rhodospirillaceae bacterium]|nr:SDR family NAD(P)-dependent oxidoreductase [Rhodospirillaceae bacterium]
MLSRLEDVSTIVDAGLDEALEARSSLWRGLASLRDGRRLLVLRPAGSSAGALAGGYGAVLSGEYGGLLSREVQLEAMDGAAAAAAVRSELGIEAGPTRSLWRDGARYVPGFAEAVASEGGGIDLSTLGDGPVLITGGLGGLGLALARHLASRGVTKIALAGLRPLTEGDGRAAAVAALRQSGAEVAVHTGSLEDPAFSAFVADLRSRWGPMRLAVHAAGRVGDGPRAFVSRDAEGMRAVAGPKVEGLAALEKALGEDPVAALVLYSSISASVPSLAGGLVDYAAANAALEARAVEAWSRGDRHVRAIAWGSWTESGLGAADGERLATLGLAGLSDAEGVALFERALEVDAPVVIATGLLENAPLESWPLARMAAPSLAAPTAVPPPAVPPAAGLLSWLSDVFARELRLPAEELDPDRRFEDYGVDSILLADLVVALEGGLGTKLEPGLLLEHRTLATLAAHLDAEHGPAEHGPAGGGPAPFMPPATPIQAAPVPLQEPAARQPAAGQDRRIAVIGLACDVPGAGDAEAFWSNLAGGVDSIREVPAERWPVDRLYDPEGGPGRSVSKWGGFIEGVALFDPGYFGIPEEDAASLDPLVRKALEVSVQCLRHGGYRDEDLKGTRTGVFLGARMGDYGRRAATRRKRALTGSAQNFIAAQVAHCLDLHGANLVVDTACSSSLTAVHLACRSLLDGESDYALAGGVDLLLDETPYLGLSAGQALSPRGRCRTFDAGADGFVPGEGAGVVLLRRLDEALASGDRVLAVIEGGAVNNDGRTMGLTTPNPEAQEAVIRAALARADAEPESVTYVEAHGTGTLIGDPIELKALGRALGDTGGDTAKDTGEIGRCGVGSVKTNIGHLLSAAGIASLIKVVLMVERGILAPTLHCATPNPRFAFGRSALRPVTEAEPWMPRGGVRRAGVSSFGFGGTNVHLVVSDAGIDRAAAARQALQPQVFDRKPYWI